MISKQAFESFDDSSEYNLNNYFSHLVKAVNEI